MKKYVQFTDADEIKILSIFGAPQNPDDYPNYAEIEEDDPRLAAFDVLAEWREYQSKARRALAQSDTTMMRITEAVIMGATTLTAPGAVAWAEYRRSLRAILGTASGDPNQDLPERPAYPVGT